MSTAAELVYKGAALLDKHFGGPYWVRKVNTQCLDMSDDTTCVLGQLFGDFETGQIVLCCAETSVEHGYLADNQVGASNSQLTEAWTKYIHRMRSPKVGDQVVVSYNVEWPKEAYTTDQTYSPYAMRSAIVIIPKADPEPGDRIRHRYTEQTGSVLKPRPIMHPGCIRVAWDKSGTIGSAVVADLHVISP